MVEERERSESRMRIALDQFREQQSLANSTLSEFVDAIDDCLLLIKICSLTSYVYTNQ